MDNDSSSIYKNSIFSSTGFKRSAFNNNNNNSHTHMTYSMNTSLNTDTVKILNCLRTTQNTQVNNTNCLIKEYTYDDIKRICMKVFMNYAMPKNGQFFLSYQALFKILVSVNIINEQSFPLKEADLIAQKVIKGNRPFTSDDFLNYIAQLASRLDNEYYEDRKATMINFVKTHFEPLAIKIDNNRDQSLILNKFNRETTQNNNPNNNEASLNNSLTFQKFIETFVLDENIYLVLTSIAPALKQIYSVYFQYENSNQHDLNKIEKGSYSNFISFCKDFEISPYLINNRLLALYWGIVISTPLEQLINNTSIPFEKFNERVYNIGIVYTFPKFLLLFAHASSFYYNTTNLSEGKQMLYLIEKLHESQGYKNLNKKASVPFNRKYSIIPSKEIILLLDSSLIDDNKDDFCNKNTSNNSRIDWISEIKAILLLSNDVFNTFFPYFDQLKDYYRIYSQYGDKMNYAKMNFSNYRKMFYDGGLMQHSMKGGKRRSLNMSVLTTIRPNMNFSMNMSKITKNDGDNTNNCKKINKALSKTISDPLYKEVKNRRHNNNNNSNTYLDLSMTLSKICLSLGKDRNKLDETDINIIFSKLTRNINLNKPRESKTINILIILLQ